MAEGALSHIRVIDLSHYVAGPFCTKLMAGFGAEVIKIERPASGDIMRGLGPFYQDTPGIERSIPFLWLNTGKKSVTLNLKSDTGKTLLKRLVQEADVVVENFSPRVLPGLGLGYEELKQLNPHLIMTSISNFGQTGPYRDYKAEEIQAYAMSGLMHLTGHPDKAPLGPGPAVAQYTAALNAYTATLIALFHRGVTGTGQQVDVSIQETAMTNIEWSLVEMLHEKKDKNRNDDHHALMPWEIFPCADGSAAVVGGPTRHWDRAAALFDDPRLFDEQYHHSIARLWYRDEYEALLRPCVKKVKKRELFHRGQEQGLAFGFLADLQDAVDSPQHKARGFFVEIDHPAVNTQTYLGSPYKMSKTPWQSQRAPLLGEHTDSVCRELIGLSEGEVHELKGNGVL